MIWQELNKILYKYKTILIIGLSIFMLVFLTVIAINIFMIESTKKYVVGPTYDVAAEINDYDVAVILGTSSRLPNGNPNPFFQNRIWMGKDLFHNYKISKIIVSGHISSKYYNEPLTMRDSLVKYSVPEDQIIMDSLGKRTHDTILRAKEEFGLTKFVIVTQKFHCFRALYIAKQYGIDAIAVPAMDENPVLFRVHLREYLARVGTFFEFF